MIGKIKIVLCLDDDKMLQSSQLLREMLPDDEDGIDRQHHTRENRKGRTIHVVSFAANCKMHARLGRSRYYFGWEEKRRYGTKKRRL